MRRLLVLIGCLLVCSQVAWGHAALVAASPAPGAVLQSAPSAVVLTFSEPVGVTALRLFDPDGKKLAIGPVADHDREIRIPLPADAAARGTYLLSWRIVSADGHPVGGTLDYSVGQPGGSSGEASQPASSGPLMFAIWLARWLGYLCLFAAAGAALFRVVHPSDRHAWARPGIVLGLILLPVDLGLQGLDMQGSSWSALGDPAVWTLALSSTYARTLGLDALALLAALAAITTWRHGRVAPFALAAVVLAGLGMAVSGHAGTAPPQWLSRSAVTLHVMMAIAWVGVLIPLARSLAHGHAAAAGQSGSRPLAAFSRWIAPAVVLLVLSGLTLAWLQLDRPDDLWRTDYGRVLLAKLFLVGLLLCLAAYNRWGLTRAALRGIPAARRRLGAAIRVETVLAVLILSVVSLWRFTPPPRSADLAAPALPAAVTLADSRLQATVAPGVDGWRVVLSKTGGGTFDAQGVALSVGNAAAGIEPIVRKAKHQANGTWLAAMPSLAADTPWQIGVTVLVDDFDQITLKSGAPAAAAPGSMSMDGMGQGSQAGAMPDMHAHGAHGAHPPADARQDVAGQIAQATRASVLSISGCWVRLLPRPVPSAAYFVVENAGSTPVTLLAADTSAFGSTMLHRTVDEGGMSTMQAAGALLVPAHGTLAFAPNGYHAMLEAPTGNLAAGDTIEMRFLFSGSQYAVTRCAVEPPSFLGPK